MTKQQTQDAPIEMVLVRYWEQHGSGLASAEMVKVSLGYWSDFFAGKMVSEVTPALQREFVAWLKAKRVPPLSDGYIKRILTDGKSALNRAYKEGEINTVPYIIPGQDSAPKELVLSVEDSAALWLATEHPHERMMLALLYGTLARPEAALDIDREFMDFRRGLLNTNRPGRRQTKKYRPVVPVASFLRPWLEAAPPGPLVRWNGQPIDSFKTAWRKLRRRAWLPREAVPKTIRHTMATELRAAGVPEAEIQGFMGHRAFSGKTEVYAKYRPDYLGEATTAIDKYMDRVRASCVLADDRPILQPVD